MYSITRIVQAVATFSACMLAGAVFGASALAIGSLLLCSSEPSLGAGIQYLGILSLAAVLGAVIGILWADNQLRTRITR